MHNFYDPSKKTDHQLQDDMGKMLEQRARAYNKNIHSLVADIDRIIEAIQIERENRQIQESLKDQPRTQIINVGEGDWVETPDNGDIHGRNV